MNDDLISRQAVLDAIEELKKIHFDRVVVLNKVRDRVLDLSPVNTQELKTIHGSTYGGVSWGGTYKLQEPMTGHWIDKDDKSAVCSCCNRNNTLFGDYCKWCGAKMVEPQESEE